MKFCRPWFLRERLQYVLRDPWRNRRAQVRAFWWILVRRYLYEICWGCGRPVGLVWMAKDEVWRQVHGGNDGGVCCIPCFDAAYHDQTGDFIWWHPRPLDELTREALETR